MTGRSRRGVKFAHKHGNGHNSADARRASFGDGVSDDASSNPAGQVAGQAEVRCLFRLAV